MFAALFSAFSRSDSRLPYFPGARVPHLHRTCVAHEGSGECCAVRVVTGLMPCLRGSSLDASGGTCLACWFPTTAGISHPAPAHLCMHAALFLSVPQSSCFRACPSVAWRSASFPLLRATLTLACSGARAGAPFIFCAVMLLVALGLALTISPTEVKAARADPDPTLAEPLLLGEPLMQQMCLCTLRRT